LSSETIPQTVLFPDLFDRPLVATFDQAHASSNGGAILLKAADTRLGVTAALAGCLTDGRTATRIAYTVQALVAQRVLGIACGYPDANDADRLADDPASTMAEVSYMGSWTAGRQDYDPARNCEPRTEN
jgi:hypothetical protein